MVDKSSAVHYIIPYPGRDGDLNSVRYACTIEKRFPHLVFNGTSKKDKVTCPTCRKNKLFF